MLSSPPPSVDLRTFAGPSFPRLRVAERGVCYGQTGTGKTTLAEGLCREHQWVVALDTKANPPLAWPGFRTYYTFEDVRRDDRDGKLPARIIYEPSTRDVRQFGRGRSDGERESSPIAECFRWVYGRGSTLLYVDEVMDVTVGSWWIPEGYEECLRKGRARLISVLSSTQTPTGVPSFVLSQAEHAYIFFLKMPRERQKVHEMTGVDEDEILNLPKTYFIYAEQGRRKGRLIRLNLGGS